MQRNLHLLNIYTFLTNFVCLLPVIVPFYRDEIGLSFGDFLIGETIFAAMVIICEVPTGWLADIWGRKRCILLASVTGFIGYACIAFADTLLHTIIGQAIIGIAVSLHSGTLNACLYDSLLSLGKAGECRRYEGLRHGINLYAVAAGSIAGGLLYQVDHHLPVYVELGAIALAFIVGTQLQEPPRLTREVEKNPFHDVAVTLRLAIREQRQLITLTVLAALAFSTTKLFLWAQQPYYSALRIPEGVYGFILAGAMLSAGLASQFGDRILFRVSGQTVMAALLALVAGICLLSGYAISYVGFFALLLGPLTWGFGWPRLQEVVNHAVGSERRATVLSSVNLVISLSFIPFSLLLGWIEHDHEIARSLLVQGGLIALLGSVFWIWLQIRTDRS